MNLVVIGSSGQLGKEVMKLSDNNDVTLIPFTRVDWDMSKLTSIDFVQKMIDLNCTMIINSSS